MVAYEVCQLNLHHTIQDEYKLETNFFMNIILTIIQRYKGNEQSHIAFYHINYEIRKK